MAFWPEADLPVDSPYWWTTSEAVSAAELRATLLDRAANRERYFRASEQGLTTRHFIDKRDGAPREVASPIPLAYVHPDHDSLLVPLWLAFGAAAERIKESPRWDPERGLRAVSDQLLNGGMSADGTARVSKVFARRPVALAETHALHEAEIEVFERILGRARFWLGDRGTERALLMGRDKRLGLASFSTTKTVARLRPLYLFRPMELETDLGYLSQLRNELSQTDWDVFRNTMRSLGKRPFVEVDLELPEAQPLFFFTHRIAPALALLGSCLWLRRRRRQTAG